MTVTSLDCMQASGRWYLIAAKKPKMMDKANIQSRMKTCGGFSKYLFLRHYINKLILYYFLLILCATL